MEDRIQAVPVGVRTEARQVARAGMWLTRNQDYGTGWKVGAVKERYQVLPSQ